MKKIFFIIFLATIVWWSVDVARAVGAQPASPQGAGGNPSCTLNASGQETCNLTNPLKGNVTNVPTLVGMIIKAALSIVGAISLYQFVTGGFVWLTSAGNPEKVKAGAQTMLWAAIGLFITFSSYLILSTLINKT